MTARKNVQMVESLRLDAALFLMDPKNICLNGLPFFIMDFLKSGDFFLFTDWRKHVHCPGCLKNLWLKEPGLI